MQFWWERCPFCRISLLINWRPHMVGRCMWWAGERKTIWCKLWSPTKALCVANAMMRYLSCFIFCFFISFSAPFIQFCYYCAVWSGASHKIRLFKLTTTMCNYSQAKLRLLWTCIYLRVVSTFKDLRFRCQQWRMASQLHLVSIYGTCSVWEQFCQEIGNLFFAALVNPRTPRAQRASWWRGKKVSKDCVLFYNFQKALAGHPRDPCWLHDPCVIRLRQDSRWCTWRLKFSSRLKGNGLI